MRYLGRIFLLFFGLATFAAVLFFSRDRLWKKETPYVYEPKTWSTFTQQSKLRLLVDGFGIDSILDFPAMDHDQITDLGKLSYIGVAEEKERAFGLQALYGGEQRRFYYARAGREPLPRADMILCWDRLFAMPSDEVKGALLQFKKSGAKFLLMYHHPNLSENVVHEKGYGPINWKLAPYHFPDPIIQLVEPGKDGALALWSMESLP